MGKKDIGQASFEINPDTALTSLFVTWNALGVALAEIGKMHTDDSWKPALREKMLLLFEKGKITEEETGQGVMHPAIAPHLKNFGPDAFEDGIRAVDAALDRIIYQNKL